MFGGALSLYTVLCYASRTQSLVQMIARFPGSAERAGAISHTSEARWCNWIDRWKTDKDEQILKALIDIFGFQAGHPRGHFSQVLHLTGRISWLVSLTSHRTTLDELLLLPCRPLLRIVRTHDAADLYFQPALPTTICYLRVYCLCWNDGAKGQHYARYAWNSIVLFLFAWYHYLCFDNALLLHPSFLPCSLDVSKHLSLSYEITQHYQTKTSKDWQKTFM